MWDAAITKVTLLLFCTVISTPYTWRHTTGLCLCTSVWIYIYSTYSFDWRRGEQLSQLFVVYEQKNEISFSWVNLRAYQSYVRLVSLFSSMCSFHQEFIRIHAYTRVCPRFHQYRKRIQYQNQNHQDVSFRVSFFWFACLYQFLRKMTCSRVFMSSLE